MINRNTEKENVVGCYDALLIVLCSVYVVKLAFQGLQRAPENSVLATSHQDLLDFPCPFT